MERGNEVLELCEDRLQRLLESLEQSLERHYRFELLRRRTPVSAVGRSGIPLLRFGHVDGLSGSPRQQAGDARRVGVSTMDLEHPEKQSKAVNWNFVFGRDLARRITDRDVSANVGVHVDHDRLTERRLGADA